MPTWNDGRYLGAALASIRDQAMPEIEVIVVDDGSEDPAEPVVRATLPAAQVLRQPNAGPSAARNAGLRAAGGELVAFLDADDRWTADALSRLLRGFRNAPGADVVQGYLRTLRVAADAVSSDEAELGPPRQGFNLGTVLMRRETVLAAGPFDERLRRSEDVDLFIRMSERRAVRVVVPDVVLHYRRYHRRETARPRILATDAPENWMRLLHRSLERRRVAGAPRPAPAAGPGARPSVSVLLTVRNGRPYLPAALSTLRRQTLKPDEIIAVVGPSDDGTTQYLNKQPDVRVVEQDGTGLAHARNLGLRHVGCELIALLDVDDLWHPAKLERQVDALSHFLRPAACIVNFEPFADGGPGVPALVKPQRPPVLGWTPSALIAHRSVFEAVGEFDPTLGIGCDADWFARLRRSGLACCVAGRVLLWKRRHAGSLSRDPARNRAAMFGVIRKARLERSG